MKIIIDATGGDYAPAVPCEAAAVAVRELGVEIALVGREREIQRELEKYKYDREKISIVEADEVITNEEEPVTALKKKKNSSIAVAANMLRNGEGDALLSCGSTGALLAAGLLIVGRIKGVHRPALATILPGEKGPVLLADAGANTNCRAENLAQFALMGNIYMRDVMGVAQPRIGLVSNGAEEGKGDRLTKEAYPLLKRLGLNFVGNIEGRDIMSGDTEVVVCDGFVGNVILKTVEGMGLMMGRMLKGMFTKNPVAMLGALCVSGGVSELKKKMDYREYGGAPLLGVTRPVIKGHGSSDVKAAVAAIGQAKKFVETNFAVTLAKELEHQGKEEFENE